MSENQVMYFNQHGQPVYHDFPIDIIGSSSKGNSIRFKDLRLLIDLGFPIKHYPENFFYDVSYVALTHEHGDHLNVPTFKNLYKFMPWIKFLVSKRMFTILESKVDTTKLTLDANRFVFVDEASPITPLNIRLMQNGLSYQLVARTTRHGDITNVAYEITTDNYNLITRKSEPMTIMYASDLDTTDKVDGYDSLSQDENQTFDIICLEADYDMVEIQKILMSDPGNERATKNLRHISEQEAFNYVNKHANADTIFIPLHASATFGTFRQNL